MSKAINILAFETSCDDTSVALVRAEPGVEMPEVISLSIQSQWEVHEKYGGVVPDLASRAHLTNLIPCLEKVVQESGLQMSEIDAFAGTAEPGLIGCLIIGHSAAKTLSYVFNRPFISVNHIEGHLMSAFLESKPSFPLLAAVVSGGHTSLFLVRDYDDFETVGLTLDDAAGEAFDKGAKLLGLGFPGGPAIDRISRDGNKKRYAFGKVQTKDLFFSFSGMKSELSRIVQREKENIHIADAAASYQNSILNHLMDKIQIALRKFQLEHLVIVGGVACNSELRDRLEILKTEGFLKSWAAPRLQWCTDNAAMIGARAYRKFLQKNFSSFETDVGSTSRPQKSAIAKASV